MNVMLKYSYQKNQMWILRAFAFTGKIVITVDLEAL